MVVGNWFLVFGAKANPKTKPGLESPRIKAESDENVSAKSFRHWDEPG
jgi:hypothetical protein